MKTQHKLIKLDTHAPNSRPPISRSWKLPIRRNFVNLFLITSMKFQCGHEAVQQINYLKLCELDKKCLSSSPRPFFRCAAPLRQHIRWMGGCPAHRHRLTRIRPIGRVAGTARKTKRLETASRRLLNAFLKIEPSWRDHAIGNCRVKRGVDSAGAPIPCQNWRLSKSLIVH
jgi:hypothetical protein